MSRFVLTLDLLDDPEVIASYRRYHQSVWPEVERSLCDAGVRRMDIYLHGRRLVMTLDLADGIDPATVFDVHMRSGGRVAEWERLMRSLQDPPPGAMPGHLWAQMEPVYSLPGDAAAAPPVAAESVRRP
jgi:L-rhamnose mutarotase